MNRKANLIFGGIALIFAVYVLLRAWLIPITVDESSTAISHVPRNMFHTLFLRWDANPNNHILNTLLIRVLTDLFGWHPMVFRTPALLGAMAYAWAGMRLSRQISTNLGVQIFAYALLLSQPFMLEFFSLARGYSLGLGMMMLAIWQAWRFLKENRWESLLPAVIFAGLAVYSNFTQLLFFAPFVSLLFFCAWQISPSLGVFVQKTKFAALGLGVFAALVFLPLSRLSQHAEIKNWRELGSFFDSFLLSMRAATDGHAYLGHETDLILTWLAIAFTLGICAVAIWRSAKLDGRFSADPRLFFVALFSGVLITNVLQVQITHTPYLQERLALHYWPLFVLCLATAAAWFWEKYKGWAWLYMGPVFALAFINMVRCVNLKDTREWWHDAFTYQILNLLKETQQREGRSEPYLLDTSWLLQNSFMYHLELDPRGFNQAAKLTPWHDRRPPNAEADFVYALNGEEEQQLQSTHEVVLRLSERGTVLLRRKQGL